MTALLYAPAALTTLAVVVAVYVLASQPKEEGRRG